MKRGPPSRVIDLSESAAPGVGGRRLLWLGLFAAATLFTTFYCSDAFRSTPRLRHHAAATPDREIPFLGGVLLVPSSGLASVEARGDSLALCFPGQLGEGHVVLKPLPRGLSAERAYETYFGSPEQQSRYPQTVAVLRRRRSLAGMGDVPASELVLAAARGGQFEHHILFLSIAGTGVQVEFTTFRAGSTTQLDQIEALLAGMVFRPAGS